MTDLAVKETLEIDVDRMIRTNLLSASYRYDAEQFVEFLQASGHDILDPEGWIAYQQDIQSVKNGRRISARTYNRKTAAAKTIIRFVWQNSGDHSEQAEKRFELAMRGAWLAASRWPGSSMGPTMPVPQSSARRPAPVDGLTPATPWE